MLITTLRHRQQRVFLRACIRCGRLLFCRSAWLVECGPDTTNAYCMKCANAARPADPREWGWAAEQADEGMET